MIAAIATIVLCNALAAPGAGAECAACHPGVVERWSKHGMSRAFTAVDPAAIAALASAEWTDARNGFTYRVAAKDGRATLIERRDGPPGFPPHLRERPIVGIVGAGRFDRSLVLERDGALFFAPVELSTSAGLVPAPHQELDPRSRLSFPLTRECLDCHATPRPAPAWPLHRAEGVTFTGLDCTACHGDARRHVAEHGAAGTIARLRDLAPARQLDVCARCHLQGDARIELTRDDDPAFAPGDDLFARRAAFVARAPTAEFGFVSAADRLALSRCFTKSDGRLTCTSCHDPHESAAERDAARVDRSCLACHASSAPKCSRPADTAASPAPDRGCATCHMPRAAPHDLRHVRVTDHWIRKTIPAPTERGEPSAIRFATARDGDVARFRWPLPGEAAADGDEDALALAMASVHLGHPERALPAFAPRDEGAKFPARLDRLPLFHFMRARAFEAAGRNAEAIAAYRAALERDPRDPESRTNLGRLLALAGSAEAEPLLVRLASDFPSAAAPWRNLAASAAAHGDRDRYLRCLEEALKRDSDLPAVWLELGRTRLSARDFAGGLDALRSAIGADPDLPGAWTWLGVALFQTGEKRAARAAFTEALRRDPNDRDAKLGMQRTGG